MRTAREAFLVSPARVAFQAAAETVHFDAACEYAMLALIEELPLAVDDRIGVASFHQTLGARRVLQILRTLHIKEEPKKTVNIPQLRPPS